MERLPLKLRRRQWSRPLLLILLPRIARSTRCTCAAPPSTMRTVPPPGGAAEASLRAAHARVFGEELGQRGLTGTTDARFYGLNGGMPVLVYGALCDNAHGFDEHEEAFFNRAESGTNVVPKFESFDDLDEGYQPVGFWDRVFGRTKPKKK